MFRGLQNTQPSVDPSQMLLNEMKIAKQKEIKLKTDTQYKKLRDQGTKRMNEKLAEASKLEKAGKFGRNSDNARHMNQQLNYYSGVFVDDNWLNDNTVLPPTDTTAPKVIRPPQPPYTIATDWSNYDDMIKTEASNAKKQNRKPDYTTIKKPDYKPYIPKNKKFIVGEFIHNPKWDILNANPDLLNQTDYNKKSGIDKTDAGYNAYVKQWNDRHDFLSTNPQYIDVSNFLVSNDKKIMPNYTLDTTTNKWILTNKSIMDKNNKKITTDKEQRELLNTFLKDNKVKSVNIDNKQVDVLGSM